jgi:hypothetical protein
MLSFRISKPKTHSHEERTNGTASSLRLVPVNKSLLRVTYLEIIGSSAHRFVPPSKY